MRTNSVFSATLATPRCHLYSPDMPGLLPALPLIAVLAFSGSLSAQNAAPAPASVQQSTALADLQHALSGSWVGALEYRDYSEPATSTKRVKLPTWLTVQPAGADLRLTYVYDDGPTKTVIENSTVRIDPVAAHFTFLDDKGKVEDSLSIAGWAQLHQGRGTLTLTGSSIDNGAAADVRVTMRIGRNILEITREAAPTGQPPVFRHTYTFVRAIPPSPAN
jgi:hypothetical protein